MESTLLKNSIFDKYSYLEAEYWFQMFLQEDSLPVLRGVVRYGKVYSGITTSLPHTHIKFS